MYAIILTSGHDSKLAKMTLGWQRDGGIRKGSFAAKLMSIEWRSLDSSAADRKGENVENGGLSASFQSLCSLSGNSERQGVAKKNVMTLKEKTNDLMLQRRRIGNNSIEFPLYFSDTERNQLVDYKIGGYNMTKVT